MQVERSFGIVANGVVIHEKRALKSGIYRGNSGQYQMWRRDRMIFPLNGFSLKERLMAYQVVGEVMAHQADDG
jgi:hypothetical protein